MLKCKVKGCKSTNYAANHMCWKHYRRMLRHGTTDGEDQIVQGKECIAKNCKNKPRAKNYCIKHYSQVLRHSKLTPDKELPYRNPICIVSWCNNKHEALGYCLKHYSQLRKHGKIANKRKIIKCKGPKCNRDSVCKGLCHAHYIQNYKLGIISELKSTKVIKKCIVETCEREGNIGDYCTRHHQHIKRFGKIDLARERDMS